MLLLASHLEVDGVEAPPAVTPSAVSGRGQMPHSEDDQLCSLSEVPVESSFDCGERFEYFWYCWRGGYCRRCWSLVLL